ncbi:MAG: hypothetical protein M1819_003542 [Sarea resinae]|nr:MAG: hypothetical protein M1819_003542 [Sarea resinae]
MVPKSVANRPPTPHVPAWKRLGLKLKFAKGEAADAVNSTVSPSPATHSGHKKRKLDGDESSAESESAASPLAEKRSKKRKPSPRSNAQLVERNVKPSKPDDTSARPETATLKKRKSVAFTPETKVEDGDSIKQFFSAWVAEQKAADSSFTYPPQSSQPAHHFATESPASIDSEKQKDPKKPKKPKASKKDRAKQVSTDNVIPAPTHPALIYLSQYHTDRANWKFNKIRQTYILKHLFDTTLIPPSYNDALTSYISGLQGSGARARISEAGLAVRKSTDEEAKSQQQTESQGDTGKHGHSTNEKDVHLYNETLASFLTSLHFPSPEPSGSNSSTSTEPDLPSKFLTLLQKRKRAEIILHSLSSSSPSPYLSTHPKQTHQDPDRGPLNERLTDDRPLKRRRKRRTTTVDSDDETSSSGSNSSSSDSSDDSSDDSASGSESESDGDGDSEIEKSSTSSSSSSSSEDEVESEAETDSETASASSTSSPSSSSS